MPANPPYHIREAGTAPDDVEFMVGAFDSTLPHLAAIGSSEMWGTVPFSHKDGFLQETRESVEQAEAYRRGGGGGGCERVRIFIAEAGVGRDDLAALAGDRVHAREGADGRLWLAVALACVREDWVPAYVASKPHLGLPAPEAAVAPGDGAAAATHAYLEVMIADHRTGRHHKGAGALLLQHLRQLYRAQGTRRLYVDAWVGSEKNLVK